MSRPARSEGLSKTGPEVTLIPTPSSLASPPGLPVLSLPVLLMMMVIGSFYWQLLYGISRRKCSGSDEVDDDDDEMRLLSVSLKGWYEY